jgi:hypothetical protein
VKVYFADKTNGISTRLMSTDVKKQEAIDFSLQNGLILEKILSP